MRLRLCAAALGVSLFVSGLSGCGGEASSTVNNTQDFQGSYVGSFAGTINGAADNGTLTGKVAADGTLTGMAHSNVADADATVTGTLTSAGVFNSTFVYPSVTYTATGTVSKNSLRHLVGTLTEFSGATPIGTINIDLTRE